MTTDMYRTVGKKKPSGRPVPLWASRSAAAFAVPCRRAAPRRPHGTRPPTARGRGSGPSAAAFRVS